MTHLAGSFFQTLAALVKEREGRRGAAASCSRKETKKKSSMELSDLGYKRDNLEIPAVGRRECRLSHSLAGRLQRDGGDEAVL